MEPPIKIQIETQHLANLLGIITAVSAGESSPLFLEGKVRELQEHVPFLPVAISWLAEAMDRISKVKDGDIVNDPAVLREFLIHQDMLSRAQGVLAVLICVGENLHQHSESKKELPVTESTPKKSRKGKRDVRKRD
jgi:hypothetical protein